MSSQVLHHDVMPLRHESRGPRANTHARSEVLRMLKEDHRMVKTAFREFDSLDVMEDAEACENIIRQTCIDLEIHTRLEEEVFYPAVRAALSQRVLIDDAEVEHETMRMLLTQVRKSPMGDPRQSASFRVLGEYIKHHVKEEEGEMFRQLSHAKLDWIRVLDDMRERRTLLTNELEDGGASHLQASSAALRPGTDAHGWRSGRYS